MNHLQKFLQQRFGDNVGQLLDQNHASILKSAAATGQPSGCFSLRLNPYTFFFWVKIYFSPSNFEFQLEQLTSNSLVYCQCSPYLVSSKLGTLSSLQFFFFLQSISSLSLKHSTHLISLSTKGPGYCSSLHRYPYSHPCTLLLNLVILVFCVHSASSLTLMST